MSDLFDSLCHHYNQVPDRRGEVYVSCPFCGVESSRGNVHCSFSANGFYCFVCGTGCGLRKLAEQIGMQPGEAAPIKPRPKPEAKPTPAWMLRPEPYLARFEAHPARHQLWAAYKPLPRAVIEKKRLGVGVLPASRCPHERLIVPVLLGARVVGLRGRQLHCDCGKWLAAGGSELAQMPLYNQDVLTSDQAGGVVMIVENPVDALMVSAYTAYTGVATYSVAYWREGWTERLAQANPELVVVAYDNDVVGMGGSVNREKFLAEWRKKHRLAPEPRGIALVNRLLAAGMRAVPFDWGDKPNKYDIGSMLMEMSHV